MNTYLRQNRAKVVKRSLLGAHCLTALGAAVTLSPSEPVFAALGSAPDVFTCLRYAAEQTPYRTAPLYLWYWDGQKWEYAQRQGASAANGCATFRDVQPNRYYLVQGHWQVRSGLNYTIYSGTSGYAYVGDAYDGVYRLPDGVVTRLR
jgi:hypothetical protein